MIKSEYENNVYTQMNCKAILIEETEEKALEFAKQATEILIERLNDIKSEYKAEGIDLEIGLINKNEIYRNYQKWKWYQSKKQGYSLSIRFKKDDNYFKGVMYPCLELRINLVIRNKNGLMYCITNYEEGFLKVWKYQLMNALEEVRKLKKLPKVTDKKPLEEFIK